MPYDLGDLVPLTVNVKDATGALADATAVTLTVTLPDASTATPAVTHSAVGVYQVDYAAPQVGRYGVYWVATGSNACAFADVFNVQVQPPRLLISVSDARDACAIPSTRTVSDEQLRLYIAAATKKIEDYIGTTILPQTVTESYDGGVESIILRQAPVSSVSSVVEQSGTVAAGGYAVNYNAGTVTRMFGFLPWRWVAGRQNITITYSTGGTSVDPDFILACRALVAHYYAYENMGDRGGVANHLGNSEYAINVPNYGMPHYVSDLLESHRMPGIA